MPPRLTGPRSSSTIAPGAGSPAIPAAWLAALSALSGPCCSSPWRGCPGCSRACPRAGSRRPPRACASGGGAPQPRPRSGSWVAGRWSSPAPLLVLPGQGLLTLAVGLPAGPAPARRLAVRSPDAPPSVVRSAPARPGRAPPFTGLAGRRRHPPLSGGRGPAWAGGTWIRHRPCPGGPCPTPVLTPWPPAPTPPSTAPSPPSATTSRSPPSPATPRASMTSVGSRR